MEVPTGIISIWSGAVVDIPPGWALCNGAGGTPDLRGRFVVSVGVGFGVGDTGGSVVHNHDFTGDGHFHNIPDGEDVAAGTTYLNTTDTTPAAGTTDNASSLPPYYALAYIIKL